MHFAKRQGEIAALGKQQNAASQHILNGKGSGQTPTAAAGRTGDHGDMAFAVKAEVEGICFCRCFKTVKVGLDKHTQRC